MLLLRKPIAVLLCLIVSCQCMPTDFNLSENEGSPTSRHKRDSILQLKANLFDRLYNQASVYRNNRGTKVETASSLKDVVKEVKIAKQETEPSIESLIKELKLKEAGGSSALESLVHNMDHDPTTILMRSGGVDLMNGFSGITRGLGGSSEGVTSLVRSSVGNVISQLGGGTGDGFLSMLRRGSDSARGILGGIPSVAGILGSMSGPNPLENVIGGIDSARTSVAASANSAAQAVSETASTSGGLLRSLIPNLGGSIVTRALNVEGPQPIEIFGQGLNTFRSLMPNLGDGFIGRTLNVVGPSVNDILGRGVTSVTGGAQSLRHFASNQLSQGTNSFADLANSVQGLLSAG